MSVSFIVGDSHKNAIPGLVYKTVFSFWKPGISHLNPVVHARNVYCFGLFFDIMINKKKKAQCQRAFIKFIHELFYTFNNLWNQNIEKKMLNNHHHYDLILLMISSSAPPAVDTKHIYLYFFPVYSLLFSFHIWIYICID